MFSPAIATLTLFGFRLRTFEEIADRLVEGNLIAWAQALALVIVVWILLGHPWHKR